MRRGDAKSRRALATSERDYNIFAQGPTAIVFICALALVVLRRGVALTAGLARRRSQNPKKRHV
jgi:TctA family transporter